MSIHLNRPGADDARRARNAEDIERKIQSGIDMAILDMKMEAELYSKRQHVRQAQWIATQDAKITHLRAGQFLTFKDLATCCFLCCIGSLNHKVIPHAFNSFLDEIGIADGLLRTHAFEVIVEGDRKGVLVLETLWAQEPPDKRRAIERLALISKHSRFINLHSIPLRFSPHASLPPQVSFKDLEISFAKTVCHLHDQDIIDKRNVWLKQIGFHEAVGSPLSTNDFLSSRIEYLYASKSAADRAVIESKARYINWAARGSTGVSFHHLELIYSIYPVGCFPIFQDYVKKRLEWLALLGFREWPYDFTNSTEEFNEVAEIAWGELPMEDRLNVVAVAANIQSEGPLHTTWFEVEDVFGVHFAECESNVENYKMQRSGWFDSIGWSSSHLIELDDLQTRWVGLSTEQRNYVIALARAERERFCKNLAKPLAKV